MPHCIIEHSSMINPDQLNNKVFLGALNSGLFEADGRDIKVRSVAYEHYQTGTTKEDFIGSSKPPPRAVVIVPLGYSLKKCPC